MPRLVLDNAELHHAMFTGADLTRSSFDGANLVAAQLANARFGADQEETSSSNRRGGNLYGARLDYADLSGAVFGSSDLRSASLFGAVLSGASLRDAKLDNADLRMADLSYARTNGISGVGIKLPDGYAVVKSAIVGPSLDVSVPKLVEWLKPAMKPSPFQTAPTAKQLSGLSCTSKAVYSARSNAWQLTAGGDGKLRNLISRFMKSDFSQANFDGRDLSGMNFDGAYLYQATFRNANLTGASFRGAYLRDAVFAGSTLVNVDLSGAELSAVDFSAAKEFSGIRSGCTFAEKDVRLPKGWRLDQSVESFQTDWLMSRGSSGFRAPYYAVNRGLLLGPTAVLVDANLAGVDLRNIDLSGAVLSGVSSQSVDCAPLKASKQLTSGVILPPGYKFVNGVLLGPDVNLCGVDLSKFNLDGVDLSMADLSWVKSGGVVGRPVLPPGWTLTRGYLIGPKVYLEGIDLGDSDLSYVDLSGSILVSVNLSKAKLVMTRGTDLESSRSIWPKGHAVRVWTLFGPDVDLSNVSLDARRFPNDQSLDGVSLVRANLNHSWLRGFIGKPDLPRGWDFVGKYLVGPGAALFGTAMEDPGVGGPGVLFEFTPNNSRLVKLPDEYKLIGSRLFGPGVLIGSVEGKVENVDLSGSLLTKDVLARAQLANIRGTGVISRGRNVPISPGWEVTALGNIVGPSADLTGVDLEGDEINVSDLSQAKLDRVHAIRVIVRNPERLRLPVGWRYAGGMFLGKTADLQGADLSNLVLNDDLSEADLSGAFGSGISGRPKLPQGWSIVRGFLVGPGADIICTSLTSRDIPSSQHGRFSAYFDPSFFGITRPARPYC